MDGAANEALVLVQDNILHVYIHLRRSSTVVSCHALIMAQTSPSKQRRCLRLLPSASMHHSSAASPQTSRLAPSTPQQPTPTMRSFSPPFAVCRVSNTLGKDPFALGKGFAECGTRQTALGKKSDGEGTFTECLFSGTR